MLHSPALFRCAFWGARDLSHLEAACPRTKLELPSAEARFKWDSSTANPHSITPTGTNAQDFGARPRQANDVVAAGSDRQTVRRFAAATADLNGDRTHGA